MVPRLCLDTELLTKEGTLKGRGLVVYRLCANLGRDEFGALLNN